MNSYISISCDSYNKTLRANNNNDTISLYYSLLRLSDTTVQTNNFKTTVSLINGNNNMYFSTFKKIL